VGALGNPCSDAVSFSACLLTAATAGHLKIAEGLWIVHFGMRWNGQKRCRCSENRYAHDAVPLGQPDYALYGPCSA
jgi:hypothetical protein